MILQQIMMQPYVEQLSGWTYNNHVGAAWSVPQSTTSGLSIGFNRTVPAGETLICAYSAKTGSNVLVASITDAVGNVWRRIDQYLGSGAYPVGLYASTITTPTTSLKLPAGQYGYIGATVSSFSIPTGKTIAVYNRATKSNGSGNFTTMSTTKPASADAMAMRVWLVNTTTVPTTSTSTGFTTVTPVGGFASGSFGSTGSEFMIANGDAPLGVSNVVLTSTTSAENHHLMVTLILQ